MKIKTNKDLLKMIRGLEHVQLNRSYRKQYLKELERDLKLEKQRNAAGVRGYTKADIKRLENEIKNFENRHPFIKKIKVEIY